jgi:hypothetical protein
MPIYRTGPRACLSVRDVLAVRRGVVAHSLSPGVFNVKPFFMFLLFTLHCSLFTPLRALACSSCIGWLKDRALWDSGFLWSTVLIMAMPFAVIGVIGGWIVYTYRHSNVKSEAVKREAT